MEAVRKIVNAGLLAPIIDLPWKAKDMRVEIIVMPAPDTGAETLATTSVACEEEFVPMTMEEYRAEIDRALEAVRQGRTISQAEMEKKISGWK